MRQANHLPHVGFGIRLSTEERAWLETIARQDVRTSGEVVRWLLRREAEGRGMTLPEDDSTRTRR